MIFLHTALHWEARPFIEEFKLQKDMAWEFGDIFLGENIVLAVSGIGRVKTTITVASVLSRMISLGVVDKFDAALNIGVCAAPVSIPLGSCILPNKISGSKGTRSFFPDIILAHPFLEGALLTVNSPVKANSDFPESCLAVDMEAHSFFEAASNFLSPSRIQCIKIASDHGECGVLSETSVHALFLQNWTTLLEYFQAFENLMTSSKPFNVSDVHKNFGKTLESLGFTFSERREILQTTRWCELEHPRAYETFLAQFNSSSCPNAKMSLLDDFLKTAKLRS